jgi:hypothetical protein
MVDIGSAIGGLVQVVLVGLIMIAVSIFYLANKISSLAKSIEKNQNKE